MAKSYNNTISSSEVSIAIQRILIADYPKAWTPARVDIGTPPAGWIDLGAVVEDTPSFKCTRTKFQLKTGIPQVIQYEAIMELTGVMAFSLHSNSWHKLQFALGNLTTITTMTAAGSVPFGTSTIKNYALLGVADFIDGTQVIHYMPKASPADEITEEIRPGQNQRIPLSFNLLGVVSTVWGGSELIIAERHQFAAV